MSSLWSRARDRLALVAGLGRRAEMERRLDDELAFHVDMLAERYEREGMSPEAARRAALVAFGGRERHREAARDEYRSRAVEELARDVRHAIRVLRRAPAFAATAILTTAFGIGATTVVFSFVDHVVLRPLDYAGVDRLVVARVVVRELSDAYPTLPANAARIAEWRRRCTACESIAALRPVSRTITGAGDPERVGAARVSANLLPLLGARPALGRLFTGDDDQEGRERVVLLSDALWRRRFGGDPAIVGGTIALDGVPHQVVGVLPSHFRLPKGSELGDLVRMPRTTDLLVPLALSHRELESPGEFDYAAIVRLAPGATLERAAAELDVIERAFSARRPERLTTHVVLTPLQEQVVGGAGRPLLLLLAAVGAVLLIVCVNLAMLVLARATGRAREAAVRAALGAGRTRLVRQALVEHLVLALAGGLLGVLLARWGVAVLLALAPAELPRLNEVRLDGRVLAVSLALTAAVGLGVGVLPALRWAGAAPGEVLRAGGRATAGRRTHRVHDALIAAQAGLGTVLLVAAGLFLASFVRVLHVDKGFDPERVLALDLTLTGAAYARDDARVRFLERAIDRLRSLPGVTAAAVTSTLPLEGESDVNDLSAEHDPRPASERPVANLRFVSPSYFRALGVPVRRGRAFDESDRDRGVVVLSERAARTLWPQENPIGRRVIVGSGSPPAEVVGVAADVPTTTLEASGSLIAYLPYWTYAPSAATILVGTATEPTELAATARAALRNVDGAVPVSRVRTMEQVVSDTTASRRFHVVLLALFAATALIAASVGIYGVIAQSLARRRAEIGIRMALGARRGAIHRLVLREGLTPVAVGLAAGIAVSLALGRGVAALLFEVRPGDPLILSSVAALLGLVAAAACYIPARRATGAEVMAALRVE